jgi:hypothetical protein
LSALVAAVLDDEADADPLVLELLALIAELPLAELLPACPDEHPTTRTISAASAAASNTTCHFPFMLEPSFAISCSVH